MSGWKCCGGYDDHEPNCWKIEMEKELQELRAENAKLKRTNERLAMNYQELKELRKDKARLEWMIKNRASVTRIEGEGIATNWFIMGPKHLDHLRGTFMEPREAIDAAAGFDWSKK